MAGRSKIKEGSARTYREPDGRMIEVRHDVAHRLLDRAKALLKMQPVGPVFNMLSELIIEIEQFQIFSSPAEPMTARETARLIRSDTARHVVAINRRLIHTALVCADDRVAVQAAKDVMDRFMGRPNDLPQTGIDEVIADDADTAALLPEEKTRLYFHLEEAEKLLDIARERKTGMVNG